MEKVKNIITILNSQRKISILRGVKELIKHTIENVLVYEGICFPCEVSVSIVDNKHIKELNNKFRGIDSATDVLSFPSGELPQNPNQIQISNENINPEGTCFLGDIAISAERAEEQRIEFGHCFNREIAFLTAHSMLHLLGYDHVPPYSETEMFKRQEDILDKMGITK